jgi:hypothetical protein
MSIITSEAQFRQWVFEIFFKICVELSPIIDNSTFVFRLNQLFHIEKALLLCYNI